MSKATDPQETEDRKEPGEKQVGHEDQQDSWEEKSKIEKTRDIAKIASSVWRRIDFDNIHDTRNISDEFVNSIEDAASVGEILNYPDELARELNVRSIANDDQALEIAQEYNRRGKGRDLLRIARRRPRLVYLEMREYNEQIDRGYDTDDTENETESS